MQMGLSIPFENAPRRSRQDKGYALFRLAYWTMVLNSARKRRTPRKASMILPAQPGRAMEESLVSGPLPHDPILLH